MQKHYRTENDPSPSYKPEGFSDTVNYMSLSPSQDSSNPMEAGLFCEPEIYLGDYEVTQPQDFKPFTLRRPEQN